MRIVIDLWADRDGRPFGAIRVQEQPAADWFADWLDLLRALEACVNRLHRESPR